MASNKNLRETYSHNAQIYLEMPTDETLSQRELEQLALNRLKLLKLIEKSSDKNLKVYSEKWTEDVLANVSRNFGDTFYKLCERTTTLSNPPLAELEVRKMDYISHLVLRMAYSISKELQSWYIERETEWLFLRYQVQSMESKELFLFLNNIEYSNISNEEKEYILEHLCDGQRKEYGYYKVPFNEAIDLINERKVYLKKGYAYVSFQDLIWCIMVRYRLYLQKIMLHICRNLSTLDKTYLMSIRRIKKVISQNIAAVNSNIANINTTANEDIDNRDRKITISELQTSSQHHFPLCMKGLYDQLKEVHHLKYGSRLQLGNFIKALGLSLEDSLKFWAEAFTHNMTPKYFQKNYSYQIKHMYGKVGRRREYLPDACADIVEYNVGPLEAHGCPFKAWDTTYITRKLKQYVVSQSTIDEIVDHVVSRRYQKGCSRYFQAIHCVSQDVIVESPLQYFDKSWAVYKERGELPERDNYESDGEDSELYLRTRLN